MEARNPPETDGDKHIKRTERTKWIGSACGVGSLQTDRDGPPCQGLLEGRREERRGGLRDSEEIITNEYEQKGCGVQTENHDTLPTAIARRYNRHTQTHRARTSETQRVRMKQEVGARAGSGGSAEAISLHKDVSF